MLTGFIADIARSRVKRVAEWRWRSTARTSPKPRIDARIIVLIGRAARENGLWGVERIRGELLKLGISVPNHRTAYRADFRR